MTRVVSVTIVTSVEIRASARKHGVSDESMLHALRNPVAIHRMDGYRMFIGPGTDGALLEVAVADQDAIFHAMTARLKYLPHTRGR